ncbi:right-handed parallel beta-helix repeat-containing protein [bacterium]|nr:right-handed parallel beta-helix repeat-containing protein [bacterium]
MNARRLLTGLVLFPLLSAAALYADNAVTAGKLELYPTFECLGLRLGYTGDANSNATAALSYREQGASAWREALPLARIRGNRFAGSLFFLTPGRSYEVKVTVADPDSPQPQTVEGKAVTRSFEFTTGGGRHWYVSPAGDDAAKGTREAPFKTINFAAGKASGGDIVHVLPGLYRESVSVTAAAKGAQYLDFRAEGAVVLSGADPRYDSPVGAGRWQVESPGVYSTAIDWKPGYVGVEGQRLYHYLTRAEFDEFICGEPGGWFQDSSGALSLRLSSGEDPNRLAVQIARLDCGFHLQGAAQVILEGFEIRDYGLTGSGSGVHLDRSARCVVRDCSIHGMQSQVLFSGAAAADNLIERCNLWDTCLPQWPWSMTKGHEEEGGGVMSTGGRGNVVRLCRMRDLFDGLSLSYWDKLDDESYNCDWDIYDNDISSLRDDIMEPEGPCINVRIWNNVCYELFAGISLAPIQVGPTYVLYNVVSGGKIKDIKYMGEEPGWCYILHNTFYGGAWRHNSMEISNPFQTQYYRNNIFYSNAYAMRLRRAPLPTASLDYDCWYSSDDDWSLGYSGTKEKRLFFIDGKELPHLEQVRQEYGWEPHGLQADPRFTDQTAGDFSLSPDSPCLDRGAPLPGINDGFQGAAPDMGAFERGRDAVGAFPLGRPAGPR